jgi:hypothetical protein
MRNLGAGAGGVTAGLIVGGGGGWLSIQLEFKQIKHDCAEDARRRGVLPGRARLYR